MNQEKREILPGMTARVNSADLIWARKVLLEMPESLRDLRRNSRPAQGCISGPKELYGQTETDSMGSDVV